jgi:hypothetical protein
MKSFYLYCTSFLFPVALAMCTQCNATSADEQQKRAARRAGSSDERSAELFENARRLSNEGTVEELNQAKDIYVTSICSYSSSKRGCRAGAV